MANDVNSLLRPDSIAIPAEILAEMDTVQPVTVDVQVTPRSTDSGNAALNAQYQKVARSQATLAVNLNELDRMVYQFYKTGV